MGGVYDHDKGGIRRRMQERRAALAPADVARASARACARVLALPAFAAARHVVVYDPVGNELDPGAIAARADADAKPVYYPKPRGTTPGFVCRRPRDSAADDVLLGAGMAGILFLVPGVAFDARGARLGRGAGWYDRALAAHPRGVRVGLAFEFQVVPALPEAPWDVRMHAVVTDERLLGDPSPAGAVKENGS
jgi:5-formyltetrahydrofolate cyclo-ligase